MGLKENLKKEIKNMFEGGGGTIGVDLFLLEVFHWFLQHVHGFLSPF